MSTSFIDNNNKVQTINDVILFSTKQKMKIIQQ